MKQQQSFSGMGSSEILQIAEAVAREKNIMKDSVIEAMEQAIQVAGRRKYGHENDIRAEIDRKTGEVKLYRYSYITDNIEDTNTQISLEDALHKDPNAQLGQFVIEPLPPIDLGRVAAQTAKQVIMQKVKEAERGRQFDEFKEREGQIVNGVVKRLEYGNVVVEVNRVEAVIERNQLISNEIFRVNDRVRAYVSQVRRDNKHYQIHLSRTHPAFMAKLFEQEVPEIYDGVIEIKAVARDAGSRAKIAVFASDSGVDAVGSCVGVRGARVQAVIAELQGEKIDVVEWSSDPAAFVVNALTPSQVSKVIIDEEKHLIEVVLPSDQLSLAIGRRGQNVRLASELVDWEIDLLTEDEESSKRTEEFTKLTQLFIAALDVEEVIAQLLVAEGFTSINEVAYVKQSEIANIEGFDDGIAEELQKRAKSYIEALAEQAKNDWKKLGVSTKLAALPHISDDLLVLFGNNEIKKMIDLADLSRDEFKDFASSSNLSDDQIDEMIMAAREIAYK